MSLQQQIIQRLEQLASQGPNSVAAVIPATPDKGYIIGVPADDEHDRAGISLNLADFDRYSVALRHLEVFNKAIEVDKGEAESYLRQVAAAISQRLTYLEETLVLVELNVIDHIAQLRSSPPQQTPNETTYWEVMLYAWPHPHARLTRCRWIAGNRERVAVSYPATFAMLGRLAQDLVESLGVIKAAPIPANA